MLQRDTAKLSIVQHQVESSASMISVKIENLSGHKFPTAYPSRRAWLEFVVRDNREEIVFESGRVNKAGQICDGQGRPIATELAGGPTQPHFDTISNAQQVQIYETFMQDNDGNLTFALLRGSQFKKDNRLLPQGGAINMHTPYLRSRLGSKTILTSWLALIRSTTNCHCQAVDTRSRCVCFFNRCRVATLPSY